MVIVDLLPTTTAVYCVFQGMPLEAVLQELHRVTLNAAVAEGATQRSQLLSEAPALRKFCKKVMKYLTEERRDPEAPAPDLYDPTAYPQHPSAKNAMPLLTWKVVFDLAAEVCKCSGFVRTPRFRLAACLELAQPTVFRLADVPCTIACVDFAVLCCHCRLVCGKALML